MPVFSDNVSAIGMGVGLTCASGLFVGLSLVSVKLMRGYRYEHWAFLNALVSLVLLPWAIALYACADLPGVFRETAPAVWLTANLCSMAWGVANVLCGLCLVRLGVSLTMGVLTGIGLPVGILFPMVLKGTGFFASAPALGSLTGLTVVCATLCLVAAVALLAWAGDERERAGPAAGAGRVGRFGPGLAMAVAAGVLQVGMSFAFVYSQGHLMPIVGPRCGTEWACLATVWALILPGGALVSILFPLACMCRAGNARALRSGRDFSLTLLMSGFSLSCLLCMGSGMRLLGVLGASLGFGFQQAAQILSSQGVGAFFGEWSGLAGATRRRVSGAVALMLAAVLALALIRAGTSAA